MEASTIDKVWVLGRSGRLGSAITEILTRKTNFHVVSTDKDDIDVRDPKRVMNFVERFRPDYIIHSAALRDRELIEKQPEIGFEVHSLGARNLAIAANNMGAQLIYLSSDFVFSGDKTSPYNEFDPPFPKTKYGQSKLAGENFLKEFSERHTIIRSSWLYGKRAIHKIIQEAKTGQVTTSHDLIGSPTSNLALANAVINLLGKQEYGTFHLSSEGHCSHAEFVSYLLKKLNLTAELVEAKGHEAFFALRPKYQVLDNMMLRLTQQKPMLNWQEDLDRYLINRKIGG